MSLGLPRSGAAPMDVAPEPQVPECDENGTRTDKSVGSIPRAVQPRFHGSVEGGIR